MPKQIGSPKTGGRKKGTPNKNTSDIFEALNQLEFNVPEKLVHLLPSLSPDKQADILISLMPFLYPKRKSVEQKIEVDAQVVSTDKTKDFSEEELKKEIHKLRVQWSTDIADHFLDFDDLSPEAREIRSQAELLSRLVTPYLKVKTPE